MNSTNKTKETGLLLLRVGIGIMFLIHGTPKLTGGPEKWAMLGGAMSYLGLGFAPAFWGFMAAFSEAVGGLMLIVGLFFRPAAALMAFTMMVATINHLSGENGFQSAMHPIEDGIVFLSFIFTGPGIYSLDRLFFNKRR